MAGRKFCEAGGKQRRNEPAGVSGKTDYRVTRIRGSRGPEPQVREKGGVGTPGVGRKAGARSTSKRKKAWTPGSSRDQIPPRGQGAGPPPRWGHVGRGAEGSAQAVLRRPRYICPVPGATSFPILRSRSLLHSTATPPLPAYPRPWLCSRDPSVPPASLRAHRACALRSCRLPSAEAAAASPLRSHGVVTARPSLSNRLSRPFKLAALATEPGGVGRRGITVAQAQKREDERSRTTGACTRAGAPAGQLVFKEDSHVRVRLRTLVPRRGGFPTPPP